MSLLTGSKRRSSRRKFSVQKPHGILHPRVEKVGPQHFGVVCFDCHKAASKWMLADFYGKLLVEPAKFNHTRPELELVGGVEIEPQKTTDSAESGWYESVATILRWIMLFMTTALLRH